VGRGARAPGAGPRVFAAGGRVHARRDQHVDLVQAREGGGRHKAAPAPLRVRPLLRHLILDRMNRKDRIKRSFFSCPSCSSCRFLERFQFVVARSPDRATTASLFANANLFLGRPRLTQNYLAIACATRHTSRHGPDWRTRHRETSKELVMFPSPSVV